MIPSNRRRITLVAFVTAAMMLAVYMFHDSAIRAGTSLYSSTQAQQQQAVATATTKDLEAQKQQIEELKREVDKLRESISKHKEMPKLTTTSDADAKKKQKDEACKNAVRNIDYYHSVNHEQFWQHASPQVWADQIRAWRSYMDSVPSWESVSAKHEMKGRGIVIAGGNGDTLDRTKVTLRMLRELNSTLPVEVHYIRGELGKAEIEKLKELGATPRDLSDESNLFSVQKMVGKEKNFHIKSAAMINSRFEEILYLDSDSMPVRDPRYLFGYDEYEKTGTMFWPDYWKTHKENPIWDILDAPCADEWEQESGQVLLNKRTNWKPLLLANYMSMHSEFYFQLINGDKDTLRFAHKALKMEYFMVPKFLTAGGLIWDDRFCGHTMIQHDPDDAPMFIHANLLKEFPRDRLNPDTETNTGKGVFRTFKMYTVSRGNTWLKPRFYVSSGGQNCMEIDAGGGEPDIREESFENLVPGWNAFYKRNGGQGGGR